MSQKKVDYYKQAKANRKREEKKKNLRKAFDYTILGLIALAIVVWIGWSAYDMYESKQPRAVAEVDYSAVNVERGWSRDAAGAWHDPAP